MSSSIHCLSPNITGSGLPDGRYLPFSGLSGRALGLSPNSTHTSYKIISDKKHHLSLKCSFRHNVTCNASPNNNYRRNTDSRKHNFSRNRNNRHKEDREDDYEEQLDGLVTTLPSENGAFSPVSSNQSSRGTATPGAREREIVELFKKVQAKIRERAALKEEEGKKAETSQGKGKESQTVDSLLKLLRKHSVPQDKKAAHFSDNDQDFILDQKKPMDDEEIQDIPRQNRSRPKSRFQKRSPVPESKFQPVYSDGSDNSISDENLEKESEMSNLEVEADEEEEALSDESDVDALFPELSELDEISGLNDEDEDEDEDEDSLVEADDLSGKKLPELRALAKSRGLKGYSKLKKGELIELLSE